MMSHPTTPDPVWVVYDGAGKTLFHLRARSADDAAERVRRMNANHRNPIGARPETDAEREGRERATWERDAAYQNRRGNE